MTLAVQSAHADPLNVAPADWKRKSGGGITTLSAPDGYETIMYAELPASVSNDKAGKQVATLLKRLGCNVLSPQSAPAAELYRCHTRRDGTALNLLGAASTMASGAKLITIHTAPTNDAAAMARQADVPGRLARLANGEPLDAAIVAANTPRAAEPSPAPKPASPSTANATLTAIVFDLDYVVGTGGFTYPEYEPVYLFKDGRACRCTEYAPDAVTGTVWSRISGKRRGRWSRNAGGYRIDYDGDDTPEEVKRSIAEPRPLPDARLSGDYQAIGGGGNMAMGGSTVGANVRNLSFSPDGSFEQTSVSAGSNDAGSAYRKGNTSGTYTIDGPTLELRYGNGRTVRTSILYSSKRKASAEFGRLGVLWIGGEGYKRLR